MVWSEWIIMGKLLRGIGVSPGLSIGKALKYRNPDIKYGKKEITIKEIDSEKKKLTLALNKSQEQLTKVHQLALSKIGEEEAEIFEAYIMLLNDEEFVNEIYMRIQDELKSAPEAVTLVASELSTAFNTMDDEYMQARAADIIDLSKRIKANLLNIKIDPLIDLEEEVVLVAVEIAPSDLVLVDSQKIKAIITEKGGPTSHAAIMARSLEIPGITGCHKIMKQVIDGDILVVDGEKGELIINPSKEEILKTEKRINKLIHYHKEMQKLRQLPAITRDGRHFQLLANIGSLQDIDSAIKYGAEGVGLFRSEFIYMGRKNPPSENEQFAIYKRVAEAFKGKPVTIRTLDIGGDKDIGYFKFPAETNPFLGWRGIRFCLDNEEIFRTQLKAILKAANYGCIEIMYPMISVKEDLEKANNILDQARQELLEEGIPVNNQVKVGVMIETPAAAIIADELAAQVHFFSIGTNDLIQYTMAADRTNKRTMSYYLPENRAILRLLKMVVDRAHHQGIPAGICGEMAADPSLTQLLIGLGFDKLSLSPPGLPEIKKNIRNADYAVCKEELQKVL
jgi:phosphotransferase system enzyme I (PtsI)